MAFSVIPAFAGMLGLALLPKDGLLWQRWGLYFITIIGNLAGPSKYTLDAFSSRHELGMLTLLTIVGWTMVPSNIAGRTKKSIFSTALLIAYCAGNCIGAQVFQDKDAPRYIPAIVVCSVMYGLQFVLIMIWRAYCKKLPGPSLHAACN